MKMLRHLTLTLLSLLALLSLPAAHAAPTLGNDAGTLWTWGFNYAGQLGDGTKTTRTSPVQIGSETSWKSVATGNQQTVAVQAALLALQLRPASVPSR
jgi:hypothetical protein